MKIIKIVKQICSLPKKTIQIVDTGVNNEIEETYKYFVKWHPKYKIIKNKTIGVMLYDIPKNLSQYEKEISGKNSVSYYSRRCQKFGYYTKYFKQPEHLKELYEINSSSIERQGKKMSASYLNKLDPEKDFENIKYFGVFSKDNILVGYIRLVVTPKIFIVSKILGHKSYLKDNIMYLLLHNLIIDLIENNSHTIDQQVIMYDTLFGASEGLKLFKKRNCFKPYKVKWEYIKE